MYLAAIPHKSNESNHLASFLKHFTFFFGYYENGYERLLNSTRECISYTFCSE